MAPAEADAKMVVATGREDCKKLKDLVVNQQDDATTMVVVMASNQASDENNPSPTTTMHPLLAAAACRGNWEELNFLLNREGPRLHPSENLSEEFRSQVAAYFSYTNRRPGVVQQATADMEVGIPADSLLKGVTVEGATVLHVVAANGDGQSFMDCADLIHSKDKDLLCKQDQRGDTPLHWAAKARKRHMVTHLIRLASLNNIVEELLRKVNNSKETALHEAVRTGDNDIVEFLLGADPKLARFPEENSSALYLAILQGEETIAQTLYDKSEDHILSYAGPDGQNALHAAVLRSTAMVEKLLHWNKSLTSQVDRNGSTPLHFLSSQSPLNSITFLPLRTVLLGILLPFPSWLREEVQTVLEANQAALYQPDNCGLFPIHIAAFVGAKETIAIFVKRCPSSAGLRDEKGRTFLHIAVENLRPYIVKFACRNPSLAWILNMQDNDGNTALHLAVEAGSLRMFCYLFGNRQVHLNIANKRGQTPLDISLCKLPSGQYYTQGSAPKIFSVLQQAGGKHGSCRWDHFEEKYILQKGYYYESKELEKLKDSSQTLCIGSVLIATVTFGASFAVPGGYRADDHLNGGTPTLAPRYAFDAFIMANTLAFICSSMATVGFMFSGTSMVELKTRAIYLATAVFFMSNSVQSLATAFALGVYMVLGPVAHKTAMAIVLMSPLVVIYTYTEFWLKFTLIALTRCRRFGPIPDLMETPIDLIISLSFQSWPLVVIFGWAAIAKNH